MKLTAPPKYQPGYVAAAITAYLEGQTRHMNEAVLAEAMTRIKRTIMRQLMKPREDRKGYESNSLYIKPCARQARFTYDGVEREGLKARTLLKFLLGDIVELNVMLLAKLAGVDLGMNNEDLTVTGRDGKLIPVHPDGLLNYEGRHSNVEVKSCDSRTFDRWMDNGGPNNDWGYLTQASVEIAAWRESGVDVDGTNFIALSTGSRIGSVADWYVPYDGTLVEQWHERRALVHAKELPPIPYSTEAETEYVAGRQPEKLAVAAANGIPCAPREGAKGIYGWDIPTGRQILPMACSYCDYKQQCFPSAAMEVQGDRPIWVVPGKAASGDSSADFPIAPASQQVADAGTTLYHPMASSGPEAWDSWYDAVYGENVDAVIDAKKKMGVSGTGYLELSEADRSAFCFSVEDRIAWAAKGMAVKKKGKRK
jgi:hypothetical protein